MIKSKGREAVVELVRHNCLLWSSSSAFYNYSLNLINPSCGILF